MGFIGYAVQRDVTPGQDVVRIFLNCEAGTPSGPPVLPEPEALRPPEGVRFLHAVDVCFPREGGCRLRGLDSVSAVVKFNRLLGSLDGRAREEHREPHTIFRSADDLLAVLARVKNVRCFSR